MIHQFFGRRSPVVVAGIPWVPVVDVVVLIGLVGAAWLLVVRLQDSPVLVGRALGVLMFAGGVAASILLLVAAWMSAHRAARRVAAAVALYTGVALLLRAIDADASAGIWMMLADVSVLGVIGLLVLAVRGPADSRRDGHAMRAVVGLAVLGVVVTGTAGVLLPAPRPALLAEAALDLVAWLGVGAAGLVLAGSGVAADRPLLRRSGLAFATIGIAHTIGLLGGPAVVGALELAAVAMFLVAAVPFLLAAVRQVGRHQEASRTRLAEAEAVMASVAERDHEMRNLLSGLTGAANVLTGDAGTDGGRQLLVAAGAELARLQRMLDGGRSGAPSRVAVATVLRDLAVIHGASGMEVEVDLVGEPWVLVDPSALAQVIANLLVNCARHAPGAAVRLRARQRGDRVRIQVEDDGPGLPAAPVLARGVRGPRSTGDGLGLAITAELVREHGGSFALRSSGRGCTAEIEFPAPARMGLVA